MRVGGRGSRPRGAQASVKVLRFDTDAVLVAEGLKKGDIVVTKGINSLADGQRVSLPGGLAK